MKGKGERERYTQLNEVLWRIARSNKMVFLNEQHKDTEENNRMFSCKSRNFCKKTGYTKGIFYARMGMINDRNGKVLTEAEEITRWQEYREELYKKGLNDPDSHDGVVT